MRVTYWIPQDGSKQFSALDTFVQRLLPTLDLVKEVRSCEKATSLAGKNLETRSTAHTLLNTS